MAADATVRVSMAKAALQALGVWMVIYFCLMHCFVVWNWDTVVVPTVETPSSTNTTSTIQQAPTPKSSTPPKKRKLELTEDEIKSDPRYEELDTVLEELKAQVQAHQIRRLKLRQWSRLIQSATERLGRAVTLPSLQMNGSDDEEEPALKNLRALLQVPSLQEAYPTTESLNAAFEAALVDLHTAMDKKASGVFLNQLLDHPFTRVPFSCPQAAGLDQATIDHGLLSLEQTFAAGQADYPDGLPVSFSETYDRLASDLGHAYAAALKDAQDQADVQKDTPVKRVAASDDQDGGNCLEDDGMIVEWLEAGLDAMYRQRDTRRALLEAMQKSGVDGVILDADLAAATAPGSSRAERTTPTVPKRTLRQVLDTPLTKHVPNVINGAIDLTSGYVDVLDEWIDQTSSQLPDGNLGKAVVKAALEAAGKVPVPALPQQGGLLK